MFRDNQAKVNQFLYSKSNEPKIIGIQADYRRREGERERRKDREKATAGGREGKPKSIDINFDPIFRFISCIRRMFNRLNQIQNISKAKLPELENMRIR